LPLGAAQRLFYLVFSILYISLIDLVIDQICLVPAGPQEFNPGTVIIFAKLYGLSIPLFTELISIPRCVRDGPRAGNRRVQYVPHDLRNHPLQKGHARADHGYAKESDPLHHWRPWCWPETPCPALGRAVAGRAGAGSWGWPDSGAVLAGLGPENSWSGLGLGRPGAGRSGRSPKLDGWIAKLANSLVENVRGGVENKGARLSVRLEPGKA